MVLLFSEPGMPGLLALGLLGVSAAILANGGQPINEANRRSDVGGYRPPQLFYPRLRRRLDHSAWLAGRNARQSVQNGIRRVGNMGRASARALQFGMNKMAFNAGGMARMASNGVMNAGSLAAFGLANVGQGIARAGAYTANGFSRAGRRYANNWNQLRSRTQRRIGRLRNQYRRGWSRVSSRAGRVSNAYWRGIQRMGSAASEATASLGNAASSGVSRLGDFAAESAQELGGIATNIVDAAAAVPRSVAEVAKEQKVQDCILQAMCYASAAPGAMGSNEIARRRRRR